MNQQLLFMLPEIKEYYQSLKNANLSQQDLELIKLATQMAIALLKSGTIHNKGTGKLIEDYASAVCFWGAGKNRRIGFINPDGEQKMGADFDCVLVYFGTNWRNFHFHFSPYGHVMPTSQTVKKLLDLR